MGAVLRDIARYWVIGMLLSLGMANVCTQDGRCGANCDYECHCVDNATCDKSTGVCPNGCAKGWKGEYCQRGNSAKGKTTEQSTTWPSHPSSYANDGSSSTAFLHCANTKNEARPWWKVDLGKDCVIFKVWLLNSDGDVNYCKRTKKGPEYRGSVSSTRGGYTCKDWSANTPWPDRFADTVPAGSSNYCRNPDDSQEPWCYTKSPAEKYDWCDIPLCQALHGIKIWVDSKEYQYAGGSSSFDLKPDFLFKPPAVGKHLKIEQTVQSSLTLCEVQIEAFQYKACTGKRYGPNCNNQCQCANDAKCDDKTGKCPSGCNDRFTGPYCNIEIPTVSKVASGPTSISLQWTYIRPHDSAYDAGTIERYMLKYNKKTDPSDAKILSLPAGNETIISANVTDLTPSTTYSVSLQVEYKTIAQQPVQGTGQRMVHEYDTGSCAGHLSAPLLNISAGIESAVVKPNRAFISIDVKVTGISECFKKIDLYYKISTGGTFTNITSFASKTGTYRVQNLIPDTDYDVQATVTSPHGVIRVTKSSIKTPEDACTPDEPFQKNCYYGCHCADNAICDESTGVCPNGCANGWEGEYCQRGNILREPGITASQDSTVGSQVASLAVDGNREVNAMDKCSQTSKVDKPWWEVNLGKNYTLFSVELWNIPGSFVNDVTVCKTTAEGTEYRGKLATTKSGTTCLDWSTHSKWTPPDGADAANYCRNPDDSVKGPWCYIGQGYSDYEYCDVPWCPLLIANDVTVCKTTVEGTEYRGKLATTKSGAPCTDWSTHSKYPPPDGANAANYCRNPDNHPQGPWCYIGPGDSDYEFCDVPRCPLQRKLGNFDISLDDNVCYSNNTPEGEATKGTQEIRCSTPVVGQRLKIQLKDSPTVLTLCEVSVQAYQYRACTEKRYGPNCNNRCQCANDDKCDDKTGKCPSGCNERFTGPYCNIEIPTISRIASGPTSIRFQWTYIRPHDSAYDAGTIEKFALMSNKTAGSRDEYPVSSPSGNITANVTDLTPSTTYSISLQVKYRTALQGQETGQGTVQKYVTDSCANYMTTPSLNIASGIEDAGVKPNRAYISINVTVTGVITGCFKKIDLYYKTSKVGTFTKISSFTSQQVTHPVQNLIPYTDYDVQAIVTSPDGVTKESRSSIKTPEDVPPAPEVTEASSAPKTISITITPSDPSYGKITKYQIEWWKVSGDHETKDLGPDQLSCTFSNLTMSATYNFKVRARTSAGWGDWSKEINIDTKETIPGPPDTITVKDVMTTSLTLDWTEPKFPSGVLKNYKVECTPLFSYDEEVNSNLEKYVMTSDPGPEIKEWKFTKLIPATNYNCSVSAQTSKGFGQSNSLEVWTKAEAPVVPDEYFPEVSDSDTTDTTITIIIKKMPQSLKAGKVSKLRIAVLKEKSDRRKRSTTLQKDDSSKLTDYQTAKDKQYPGYIAAELAADFSGSFIIGDGKTHGGFYNPALKKGEKYDVIFGIVFVVDNTSSVAYSRYGEFITVGQSDDTGMIVGVIVGVLVILAAVVILVVILLRRRRQKKESGPASAELHDIMTTNTSAMNDVSDPALHDPHELGCSDYPDRSIMISDLAAFIKAMRGEAKAKFKAEYNELPKDEVKPVIFARKEGNLALNRYKNIVTYDHCRVVLKPIGEERRDYINASYIHGYGKKVNAYIASQGPLPTTVTDMWRMIWQERCRCVVMLTKLEENEKIKCSQYWPDKEAATYGPFTVLRVEECCYTDYVKRVFKVSLDREERTVIYFQFIAWPDHGVPKFASSLLNFRVAVLNEADYGKTPILVHCSAGCGRTGTFIGIDYLIRQGIAEKKVDVFECVFKMREQRTNMVQNIDQYMHLHDAILEYFVIGLTYIQSESFIEKYATMISPLPGKSTSKLQEQYAVLESFTIPIKPAEQALKNAAKNRNKSIVPSGSSRVVLSIPVSGWDDYVNAVYATGYGEKDSYVITQMPFPDTTKDLWRIVLDTGISTIVMMNAVDETYELSPVYWLPPGESMEFGPLVVECHDIDTSNSDITVRDFRISKTANQKGWGGIASRQVRHFQIQNWRDDQATPSSPEAMVDLLEMVERWRRQVTNKKILVQCLDGASQSGVFCVAHSVIEKVKVDHEVDVFQYLRLLRTSRPQLVNTYEQYKFIHDIALHYINGFDIYANFR